MNLFLDLDGVFCDLVLHLDYIRPGWRKLDGSPALWIEINKLEPRLFSKLRPYDGALDFMERLAKVVRPALRKGVLVEVSILTAIPRQAHMPYSAVDKMNWVRQYLNPILPELQFRVGPFAADKKCHLKSGLDILVDDNERNIEQWIEAGGCGVYHDEEDSKRGIYDPTLDFLTEMLDV